MQPTILAFVSLALLTLPAQAQRHRCGTPEPDASEWLEGLSACGYLSNSPQPENDGREDPLSPGEDRSGREIHDRHHRSTDNNWYRDSGDYWTPLHWNTNRYLNIYTNSPPCCYGYVSGFPSQGIAGQASDRVVL